MSDPVASRISKLVEIAHELREGASFPITRLTRVKDYGWIEIGQTDYSASLIRVLDEGGMIWESSQDYGTMDEAMKALEKALANWMKQYNE